MALRLAGGWRPEAKARQGLGAEARQVGGSAAGQVGEPRGGGGLGAGPWGGRRRTGNRAVGCRRDGVGAGGSGGWEGNRIRMASVSCGLLGCLGLIDEHCAAYRFQVVWKIQVPGVYIQITRNKFEFLKVIREIEIGSFRFGYFGNGFRY